MADDDGGAAELPAAPIDRLIGPIERFLHVEAAGGVVLLACTLVALALANSPLGPAVDRFWHTEVGVAVGGWRVAHSLEHWINDGLMALFFFVIGLEVKRELVLGELADPRRAALPLVAALGGMIAPAAIYLAWQGGGPAARGWGIVTATDIAFVVGCMAVLGRRVPHALRVMLLTLAIADDIGAILVIALGYSSGIHAMPLAVAAIGVAWVVGLSRAGVRSFAVYTLAGVVVWAAVLESGIHATLAGVVLGLLTPAHPVLGERSFAALLDRASARARHGEWSAERATATKVRRLRRATRETVSPLEYLETTLHPWIGFVVMPLFALANAGVAVRADSLASPIALAVATSLVVGKPLGITAFAWVAVHLGLARLPGGVSWRAIAAGGVLAGIGFTMSLFVAGLALEDAALEEAKVGVLAASLVAGLGGLAAFAWLADEPDGQTLR